MPLSIHIHPESGKILPTFIVSYKQQTCLYVIFCDEASDIDHVLIVNRRLNSPILNTLALVTMTTKQNNSLDEEHEKTMSVENLY